MRKIKMPCMGVRPGLQSEGKNKYGLFQYRILNRIFVHKIYGAAAD
jgi:hypothetical protein